MRIEQENVVIDTGDVREEQEDEKLEYESNSSDEEPKTSQMVPETRDVPTLDREANFLLGTVSSFGRAVRFNSRFMY